MKWFYSFRHCQLLLLVLYPFCAVWADSGTFHHINWQQLNLSPSQSVQIDKLNQDWTHTYSSLYPQVRQRQEHLKQLINKPDSREDEIMQAQQNVHASQEQLRMEATENFLKKRRLLTPEQKKRLQTLLEKQP